MSGLRHGRPARAPLVIEWLAPVSEVCTPPPVEGVPGKEPTPATGFVEPVTTPLAHSDGKGTPGIPGRDQPSLAAVLSSTSGFDGTADPIAKTASAPDSPDGSDPRTYTIVLDWRNNSLTQLRSSLLEPAELPVSDPGQPAWSIRVAPSTRTDGSLRRAGHIFIAKALVDVLMDDGSPEANHINVFSLLWTDTCELVRPSAVGWVGRIRLDSELARGFRPGNVDHHTRLLDVLFSSDDPEEYAQISCRSNHWTSLTPVWGRAAAAS